MSKVPSYDSLTLDPPKVESPKPVRRPPGTTLKETAAQVVLYLDPQAARALKLYAVMNDTKVHDLLIEAMEQWFKKKGLREPVRARKLQD